MAEQEVIKHTKKVYKIWHSKEHNLWHKLKEFLIEIFIIVFAISLSIWFHNRSEHSAEQEQVKTFLLGLKTDLQDDIDETGNLIDAYKGYDTVFTYLSKLNKDVAPNKDSLNMYLKSILSNAYLRPNRSRFDGFLSSGKIMNIEPDSLATEILYLFQEVIPQIKSSESGWVATHDKFRDYVIDNVKDADDDMAKWEVLTTPKGKYICKLLIPSPQLFDRYNNFIDVAKSIIDQIDKKYPEE